MAQDVLANEVVNLMTGNDAFSKWMGVEILEIREGYSKLQMKIRQEMMNSFGIVHGGIPFSLADTTFALACNNRNNLSVALDCAITFSKAINLGDTLIAEAKEIHNGRSTGVYLVTLTNQDQQQVALFKGTCFRTGKKLIESGSL
jgi:acyl-CoA thioesterase